MTPETVSKHRTLNGRKAGNQEGVGVSVKQHIATRETSITLQGF